MSIYKNSLLERKKKLEKELQEIDIQLTNEHIIADGELKNIDFNGNILFVDKPSFSYNITRDMIHVDKFIGNFEIRDEKIKHIVVGTYQISDENTIATFFDSLGDDITRVVFYLTPSGSIYHEGRKIRVSAF